MHAVKRLNARRLAPALVLGFAVVLVLTAPSRADWTNATYHFAEGEANNVEGPNKAFTSVRPPSGIWTATFGLSNHLANLKGYRIYVYSANSVGFHDYAAASGHSGMDSQMVLKIELSEPVTSAKWRPATQRGITPGAMVVLRYSRDGKDWIDAHILPPGQGTYAPPAVVMTFLRPTKEIYIGWFAKVPEGQSGWWGLASTGKFIFTPASGAVAEQPAPVTDSPAPTVSGALHGRRFIPNDFFATTTHGNDDGSVKLLRELNMRGVRIDFPFEVPEPGAAPAELSDRLWMFNSVNVGVKYDLDQLVLLKPSRWPTAGDPESSQAVEDAVYRVALKYKGKVKYWEASNEPNMAILKERYVLLLKAIYKGVKRADPANKVVLAGFAGIEDLHLDAVYRYGGKDFFDILASHSYTRPHLPEEGGYLSKIKALHDVMTKYGDDKPMWVTEVGWNGVEASMLPYLRAKYPGHRSYACTEEDQARGLARLYLLSATMPWIERVYFFHLNQEAPYTGIMENADYYMGLHSPWMGHNRPKDAFFSVQTVIRMLDQSTFVEQIDLGPRTWALVFERGPNAMIALWSLDDNVTMQLEDASMIKEVVSMVGTPILVADKQLSLSGRPIYVQLDANNLDAAKAQVKRSTLLGGKRFEVSVDLDRANTKPDRPVVAIEVQNLTTREQSVPTIYLKVNDPWQVERDRIVPDSALPAEATIRHTVSLRGPVARPGEVSFDVSVSLADARTPLTVARSVRYALFAPKPVGLVVDGQLDDWPKEAAIEIGAAPRQRELTDWGGPEDFSCRWYCAWDAAALYLAVEVNDDVHHQTYLADTADTMWLADSVQIGIDLAGDAKPSANVPQYDGINDVEFGLMLSKAGPVLHFWNKPHGPPGVVTLDDYTIVRDEKAKVTRYELALPWSALGVAEPPVGKWMGMNILINDNDGTDRRGWMEWAPGIGYSKDPSKFPKVLLLPN